MNSHIIQGPQATKLAGSYSVRTLGSSKNVSVHGLDVMPSQARVYLYKKRHTLSHVPALGIFLWWIIDQTLLWPLTASKSQFTPPGRFNAFFVQTLARDSSHRDSS